MINILQVMFFRMRCCKEMIKKNDERERKCEATRKN